MLIYIFLVVIVFIIISYYNSNNEDKSRAKKEGGIKTKFNFLINNILLDSPNLTINSLTERTISIGGYYGNYKLIYVTYDMDYAYEKLTIYYRFNSNYYGNYTEKFVYDASYNQQLIIEELDFKINNLNNHIFSKTFK